jgi:hypothetical protein
MSAISNGMVSFVFGGGIFVNLVSFSFQRFLVLDGAL